MFERFTEEARRVVFFARYEASQFGSREITPEHLLLGMMRQNPRLVAECCPSLGSGESVRSQVEAQFPCGEKISTSADLPLSKASKRVLAYAAEESLRCKHDYIRLIHLMTGLVREGKSLAANMLLDREVTLKDLRKRLQRSENAPPKDVPAPRPDSVIAETCRDLTLAAQENPLPPLIGREREIDAIIQVLARRNGSSPVLIGEPGVGKTSIVEGLAQRVADKQVPEFLAAKRILALDMESLMESARNPGELRDKVAALLQEVAEQANVILVIDGLFEPAARTGGPFQEILAGLLAALSFGKAQCIATGTPAGYNEAVRNDPAIERHMRAVEIPAPDQKDAIQILTRIKDKYETYHSVVYDSAAIETAVISSVQFMPRRHLPEKALDLMDEAGARVKIRHETKRAKSAGQEPVQSSSKIVTKEDIEELVAERAGLPVQTVRTRLSQK